jgi:cold shock CspA family protein
VASGKQHTASGTKHSETNSRSDSEPPDPRLRGVVQRLYPERGFGFIRVTEGEDIGQDYFFHNTGLEDCRIAELEEGLLVEFEARLTAKGKRAEHISRAL